MAEQDHQQIETLDEARAAGTTDVELWLKRIEAARDDEKEWCKQAQEAQDVYEAHEKAKTAFNIFHSNVETQVPALYNTTPIPDVRRRFGDKDPVSKMVADIVERSVSYSCDQYAFDTVMRQATRAACVPGRGQARIRYTPQPADPSTGQGVAAQKISSEPVAWDKWGRGPALFWEDVPFIWFEHDLDKDELTRLAGDDPEALKRIKSYGTSEKDEKKKEPKGILKTVKVLEVWDKASRTLLFITPQDKTYPIKVVPDPLRLEGFFPVPEPLQLAYRVKSLVPVCPYQIYKPQLEELDDVTKRIRKLINQLKVRGIVDAKLQADLERLRNCDDGEYVAAQDAAQFATGTGGLEKAVAHWPIEQSVKALAQLYVQRDQIIAAIYQVTGISDIMRGASDPSETATAQSIKQEQGSLRVKEMQANVARFARDLFRLKSEIISKHFEPQNISAMTGLPAQDKPDQAQIFQAAVQQLKTDNRLYKIDIETDSTVRADLSKKQEQMNMFLQGTAQFSSAIAGLIQGAPQIAQPALPVMVEVFSQFCRHFKLGKQAEDALEGWGDMAQQASQAPPEEDPQKQKVKAEQEAMQAKMQAEVQSLQAKAEHEERMAQLAEQKAQMELDIKYAELQLKQEELKLKQQAMNMDMAARQYSARMDMEDRESAREHEAESNAIKLQGMREKQSMKPEART